MAQEHQAINLSQGFPDFHISDELIRLTEIAMKSGRNQYAPMAGLPQLRERIAEKKADTFNCSVDPETEITVTAGATEALFASITALVHSGDEVIIFDPAYDSYAPAVQLSGGTPVHVDLCQPDFHVDWELVGQKINSKTRLLIINTPHNPTGSVLSSQDLDELEKLVKKHSFTILSDEVYEHLIFDGLNHQSLLRRPALRARSISVFSFGKTFHATGWKIGYAIAPPELTEEIRRVHQFLTFSVNTPIQYALAEFLESKDHYESLSLFFQQKRNLFLDHISDSRFVPIASHGTYFQLLSYKNISEESDVELAVRLTCDHKIASIPISVFYKDRKDNHMLRFCFAKEDETIIKAGEILCRI